MSIILDLSINISILLGFGYILTFRKNHINQYQMPSKILLGLLIGLSMIAIMKTAFILDSGFFIDLRSVLLSLCTLLLPSVSAVIGAFIAIFYRLYLGGPHILAGITTILVVLLIGLFCKYITTKKRITFKPYHLFTYSFLTHLGIILVHAIFFEAKDLNSSLIITGVYLTIFPFIQTITSSLIIKQEEHLKTQQKIQANEKKFRSIILNSNLGIIQSDTSGQILLVNKAATMILASTRKNLKNINIYSITNNRVLSSFKQALDGKNSVIEGYYYTQQSNKTIYGRTQFTPIFEDNAITSILIIIEDLTKERNYQIAAEESKVKDLFTNVYNQMTFYQDLFHFNRSLNHPVSVALLELTSHSITSTTFGYDAGEKLISYFAENTISFYKNQEHTTIYRLGGEEFTIIFEQTSFEDASFSISKLIEHLLLHNPFNFEVIIHYGVATSLNYSLNMEHTFNQSKVQLEKNKFYYGDSHLTKAVDAVMAILFEKNPREKNHSERVGLLSKEIAKLYTSNQLIINRTSIAGRLHDIGKIHIESDLLDKPGTLSKNERLKIFNHPESGFKILSSMPEYQEIANIVYAHHEQIDGQGYPRGLKGEDIPIESKIISIADAFDAMSNTRPYRKAMSIDETFLELQKGKGLQFDEKLVDLFIANWPIIQDKLEE